MALTRLKLENFTAFESFDLEISPGINVLVGANGTGKTHIMKVCYAACDISKTGVSFPEKISQVFLPSRRTLGRLVKRGKGITKGTVDIYRKDQKLGTSISKYSTGRRRTNTTGSRQWESAPIESVYIPVKEMLSNAPGFRSLYAQREIHFEAVYADILDRAYLPQLRGSLDSSRRRTLRDLQKAMNGRVRIRDEEFFLSSRGGSFEFTLLAEGFRKLGLLWLLIRNGSLRKGSVLFWDEPETNLNPKLLGTVMDVLLELQRSGVQIFLATHNYVVLEEIDLRQKEEDDVAFHSLYHDEETVEIVCNTSSHYLGIRPNPIAEAYDSIYDRMIERNLGGIGR